MKALKAGLVGTMALAMTSCNLGNHTWEFQSSVPNLSDVTKLDLATFNGEIKIRRGSNPELIIGYKRRDFLPTIERVGTTLKIHEKSSFMCFECANSIEIVLPAALEAQIESTNGNVEIERQMNNLLINTTNGSVFVKDALETTVATINGNVELENITGNLNVETTNGSVQAKTIQGKLEIDTINGQVTIQNAILPSNSSNTISTNNDDIRLQNINTQDGFVVRGSSNNGTLEFNLKGFSLRMSQDNFVATRVGQATSNLTLSSNNGSVQVNP